MTSLYDKSLFVSFLFVQAGTYKYLDEGINFKLADTTTNVQSLGMNKTTMKTEIFRLRHDSKN